MLAAVRDSDFSFRVSGVNSSSGLIGGAEPTMRSCMLLRRAPLDVPLGSNLRPVSLTVKCSAWR